MRKIIVAPSLLAAKKIVEEAKAIENIENVWLHFDVMDGHFVPNLTFGPDILKGFRKACPDKIMDVHLMVEDPEKYIPLYAALNAEYIVFHVEVECDIMKCLKMIKQYSITKKIPHSNY